MYVNTKYIAVFTVKEIIKNKNRAVIETIIKQKEIDGVVCISGEALVMNLAMIK